MHFFSEKDIAKLGTYLKVKKNPGIHEKKLWEKVWVFSPYFAKIPWILSICVWNSLAMNACHKDSDIDLFIICEKRRIWIVRILFTILLTLMWERKNSKNHAGKFCLSFFITENALDFKDISINNDIYLYYWLKTLKPVINRRSTYERFMHINFPSEYSEILAVETSKNKNILRIFWNFIEDIIKFFLLPKTKKSFQNLWKPFGVIISEDMLKFHDQDKRKIIRDNVL